MKLSFQNPIRELAKFRVDDTLLQNLLRSFYGVLVIIDYWQFMSLVKMSNYAEAVWRWPVAWLTYFASNEQGMILAVVLICTMAFHIACMLHPAETGKKSVAFVLFFMMVAASSSFGKMDHHLYGFMFASFTLIFVKPFSNRRLEVARTRFYFWATQTMVLGTYSLAGLWKVRKLFQQGIDGDWANLNPVLLQVTRISIQNYSHNPDLGRWIHFAPLTMSLWIIMVVAETFAFFGSWFPKQQRLIGVAIILFHASTAYLFEIYYLPAAILAALLFCANPYVERHGSSSNHALL
jgi:hypothetical protein